MTAPLVRDLATSDEVQWRALYLQYISAADPVRAGQLVANAWQSFCSVECLTVFKVCEVGGRVVGFANAVLHDDLAYGGMACYLQDLYVEPAARRSGVATALLAWFRDAVTSQGFSQLHWAAAADNEIADRLYRRLAQSREPAIRYVIWGAP